MSRMQNLLMEREFRRKKIVSNLKKYFLYSFLIAILVCNIAIYIVFYSPYTYLKELYVTTAMTTMNHQYLARIFVSDAEIKEIMKKNSINDSFANTKENEINTSQKAKSNAIELINIKGDKYKGYMMVISDPSRVVMGTSSKLGSRGMKVENIVKSYNATAGINAGGFYDPNGHGTGGIPEGIIIENYKVVHRQHLRSYSLVGFDSNNVLVLGKYTFDQIQKLNIRDAVSFHPFLIINGKPTITEGTGGWGIQPRTIIGQKKDGTVLFLIIDGRQISSVGATLKEAQDIMLKYGAYNASNLDGGASTTLVYNGEIINKPCSRYGPRSVPSVFLVK